MKLYLLKFDDNWADEMDLDGHMVLTEEQHEKFQERVKRAAPFTFYVGTNEEIEYDDTDELERAYEIEEMTEEDRKILQKLGITNTGFAEQFFDNVCQYGDENYDRESDW
ncbi:hypothetical protein P4L24_24630 [Bacillus cereus]|nr:hypothetical protein [Bacillus cereus]